MSAMELSHAKKILDVELAMDEMMRAINRMGSVEDKQTVIREVFRRTHRTLQQEYVRIVILPVLLELAEMKATGRYDARNEDSCRLADYMLGAIPDDQMYLSFT